jgi:hypothetical protein
LVVLERPELADRGIDGTDEGCGSEGTGAFAQRSREEIVEAGVAFDARVHRFLHVHLVVGDEPADHPVREAAHARTGQLAHPDGQQFLGQEVLLRDGQGWKQDRSWWAKRKFYGPWPRGSAARPAATQ